MSYSSINYFHEARPTGQGDVPVISFPNPVIDFPQQNRLLTRQHLPESINFPQQFHVTVGRLDQSSNTLPERTGFLSSEEMAFINPVIPQKYRGLYMEQPTGPYPDPTEIMVEPTNYEMDLKEQTYYDGTLLSQGLAEQLALKRHQEKRDQALLRQVETLTQLEESVKEMSADRYVAALEKKRRSEFEEAKKSFPKDRVKLVQESFQLRELIQIESRKVQSLQERLTTLEQRGVDTQLAQSELMAAVQSLEEDISKLNTVRSKLGEKDETDEKSEFDGMTPDTVISPLDALPPRQPTAMDLPEYQLAVITAYLETNEMDADPLQLLSSLRKNVRTKSTIINHIKKQTS